VVKNILVASKNVLSRRNYLVGFSFLTLFIFFIFVLVPVLLIPGNSLSFQLTLFKTKDYLLFSTLSVLTSLQIIMQIFSFRQNKMFSYRNGLSGTTSAIIAVLFGAASCSSCLASLFGFLGIGAVLFLAQYRDIIVIFAIFGVLISLYFTSRKVNGFCEKCRI